MALNSALNNLTNKLNGLTSTVNTLNSDTGWQHLSRSTNWNGADDYVVYRKIGRTVEIRFKVEPKSNWGVADSIMMAHDMPSSIIPSDFTVRTVIHHNGRPYFIVIPAKGLANAGQIRVQGKDAMSPGMWVVGQVTYIV